jgi:hypothetical protein
MIGPMRPSARSLAILAMSLALAAGAGLGTTAAGASAAASLWPEATSEASGDLVAVDATLQGTYGTAWHPVALVLATLEAAGLDQDRRDTGFWDYVEASSTIRWAVKFDNGTIVQYGAADGGPLEAGWIGSYRLLDDRTIEATETTSFERATYTFTLEDGILTLDLVSYSDPTGVTPQTAIFETLPFTRLP